MASTQAVIILLASLGLFIVYRRIARLATRSQAHA
jgi:hypothetical protein